MHEPISALRPAPGDVGPKRLPPGRRSGAGGTRTRPCPRQTRARRALVWEWVPSAPSSTALMRANPVAFRLSGVGVSLERIRRLASDGEDVASGKPGDTGPVGQMCESPGRGADGPGRPDRWRVVGGIPDRQRPLPISVGRRALQLSALTHRANLLRVVPAGRLVLGPPRWTPPESVGPQRNQRCGIAHHPPVSRGCQWSPGPPSGAHGDHLSKGHGPCFFGGCRWRKRIPRDAGGCAQRCWTEAVAVAGTTVVRGPWGSERANR